MEQLRKEKDDLQKSIERDQKWQEMVDKTLAQYDELSRQHREAYKKHYVQKYLQWCMVMLGEGQEGVLPPVKSGEEGTLLEVINEYRKRMEGKLCAMEEMYQSAIKATVDRDTSASVSTPLLFNLHVICIHVPCFGMWQHPMVHVYVHVLDTVLVIYHTYTCTCRLVHVHVPVHNLLLYGCYQSLDH